MTNREQVGLDVGPALTTWLGSAACQFLHRRGGGDMSHTLSLQLLFVTMWIVLTVSSASAKWFVDLYGGGAVLGGNDVTVTSDKLSVGGISPGNPLQGFSVRATLKDVEGDDFPFGGVRAGYWFDDTIPYLGVGVDINPFFLHTPAQRVRTDSNAAIEVETDDDRFVIEGGQEPANPTPAHWRDYWYSLL